MSLMIANELWDLVKSHLNQNDTKEVAENMISLFIDYGYDADDIKESFKDKVVLTALKDYLQDEDFTDIENDESDDEEDEEW